MKNMKPDQGIRFLKIPRLVTVMLASEPWCLFHYLYSMTLFIADLKANVLLCMLTTIVFFITPGLWKLSIHFPEFRDPV